MRHCRNQSYGSKQAVQRMVNFHKFINEMHQQVSETSPKYFDEGSKIDTNKTHKCQVFMPHRTTEPQHFVFNCLQKNSISHQRH